MPWTAWPHSPEPFGHQASTFGLEHFRLSPVPRTLRTCICVGTGKAGHRDSGSFIFAVQFKISFGKKVLLLLRKLVDPAVIGGKVRFEGSHLRELVKCVGLRPPGLALSAALSLATQPPPQRSHSHSAAQLPPLVHVLSIPHPHYCKHLSEINQITSPPTV